MWCLLGGIVPHSRQQRSLVASQNGKILWEYFQTHGFTFPPYDVFTFTGAETPWVNHEWFADLIFYMAYMAGGFQGAIVLKSIVLTLTFGLLAAYIHRRGASWEIACLGSLIALLASHRTFFLRPPVFTYLFIIIFFHLLESFQTGGRYKRTLLAAIAVEILWINLHGGAIIGFILIFFWCLSEGLQFVGSWLKDAERNSSFKRVKQSSFAFLAVTISSFINPFTYHIHLLPYTVMSDKWLVSVIGEMQSPNLNIHLLTKLIIIGLAFLPMLRISRIRLTEGLIIVFFLSQALSHERHIPLFALSAIPLVMLAFSEWRNGWKLTCEQTNIQNSFQKKVTAWTTVCLRDHIDVILIFLIAAYIFGVGMGTPEIWRRNSHDFSVFLKKGYIPEAYPEKAADFILDNNIQGPMFNHDNYAGYLIWRFSPEIMKVFTDSRYDLWGGRYAEEEIGAFGVRKYPLRFRDADGQPHEIDPYRVQSREHLFYEVGDIDPEIKRWYESGKEYWEYILDKYKVNFIICVDIRGLHYLLDETFHGWYMVYSDGDYVIHLRDAPQNTELIRKYALNHREHIPDKE